MPEREKIGEPGNRDKCQEPREVSEGLKRRVKSTLALESDEVGVGRFRTKVTKAEMLQESYLKWALAQYDLLDCIARLSLGLSLCLCVFPSLSVVYALI